jgi:hypothetical protein
LWVFGAINLKEGEKSVCEKKLQQSKIPSVKVMKKTAGSIISCGTEEGFG